MILDKATIGKEGERLAREFLCNQGFELLESNWRFKRQEVDLILKKSGVIIFVEVKTRTSNFDFPENAVNESKRKGMYKAASAYCETTSYDGPIRFDVISVTFRNGVPELKYFEDAFFPFDLP